MPSREEQFDSWFGSARPQAKREALLPEVLEELQDEWAKDSDTEYMLRDLNLDLIPARIGEEVQDSFLAYCEANLPEGEENYEESAWFDEASLEEAE